MNILRPKNLLIVALTQYLLQYLVLVPALAEAGREPLLGPSHFFLLVLCTVLIAAGGYVVNDLLDLEIDRVNRPERIRIGRYFSKKLALGLYLLLNLAGLAVAWYLAGQVGNRWLALIQPVAVVLLYFYSKKWKGMPLIGNVVVAIFCAGVAGVVLFAERESFSQITDSQPLVAEKLKWLFGGYIVFAFATTLLREIVKDLEDLEGDRSAGLSTLPLAWGVPAAKIWAFGVTVGMLACTAVFLFWLGKNESWVGASFLALGVAAPLLFLLKLLRQAQTKLDYARLSRLVKGIMLSGLLLLVFLTAIKI